MANDSATSTSVETDLHAARGLQPDLEGRANQRARGVDELAAGGPVLRGLRPFVEEKRSLPPDPTRGFGPPALERAAQTLNRKCMTSPSWTT